MVRERASEARRVPQIQSENGRGQRRLCVDERGRSAVLRAPQERRKTVAGPGGDRRRQGPAVGGARSARATAIGRPAVDQSGETRGRDLHLGSRGTAPPVAKIAGT